MKRLALFLLFATAGTWAVVHFAGGLQGTAAPQASADLPRIDTPRGPRPSIETPGGELDIERANQITQMAPPVRIVWKDRLSDETITIDNFQPWRCTAREVTPLTLAGTGGQGARLRDVVWESYRDPATRSEAIALRDGTGGERYAALLHQRFRAGEARMMGRLGEAMAALRATNPADRGLGDTVLELSRDLVIEDDQQGIVIKGAPDATLSVYPEQERASGTGAFTLTHEALTLTGNGLRLDRSRERSYIRVEILRDPRLHIVAANGTPATAGAFDFGAGEFRPTSVTSEGSAVLQREEGRRETTLDIEFHDRVHVAQEGGRTMLAGRASLSAARRLSPGVDDAGWDLRRFNADRHVTIHYPGRTRRGEAFLATIDAERLIHDVPLDGSEPTTIFEQDVDIRMRGELALLGPEGHLRAACSDRAWIGPLPAGAPDGGLDRTLLRQLALRGNARIERISIGTELIEDRLHADVIDLVVWPRDDDEAGGATSGELEDSRMTAVHFAAVGNVHIEGAQISGDTRRIVADQLHTQAPRLFAEGQGTTFTFRKLARDEGLLGPSQPGPTPRADGSRAPEGRWQIDTVVANGEVDINTSLGGPALGIAAHLDGDEITYDGTSRLARVRALGGAPVHLTWSASPTDTNTLTTREISVDRASGLVIATGGVEGELFVARDGKGNPFRSGGLAAGMGPVLDGAELTVRTDQRIDIELARVDANTAAPLRGAKQWIRIQGPVVTELRAPDRSVDRMRSLSLDVSLVYDFEDARQSDPTVVPAARAAERRPDNERPARAAPALERIDFRANSVRIDLADGEARHLTAEGGVDLKGRDSHVTGQRLTYDGTRRRIEVLAGSTPARALLGVKRQRSEVQAARLAVDIHEGRVVRLEAHAPRGGTSDVHLYRDVKTRPGEVEWVAIKYEGTMVATATRLTTERVMLVRRVRKPGSDAFGQPVVLRAPVMVASGTGLLATTEDERRLESIEALARGTGPGSEVNFVYGEGQERTEAWGERFIVEIQRDRARLEGRPGRDARIVRANSLTMDEASIEFDLTTNLPTFIPGSRIHWKQGNGR
ncbi:MAG: hypothetical protein O2894_02995 [Planctomycetota bacterium]|nr:hypothetical protein [Planctomycetota bacterium]